MPLTLEQVQHIANLARLELTEAEIARYRDQLSAILDYFQQLDAADTENIPPTSNVSVTESPLRADRTRPGLDLADLLKNAPDTEEHQFRVPPVFD
jgi:aspartyl-tRNA(Asn)/glutamyl-tRNA(Gln) amidotransferase subunit C